MDAGMGLEMPFGDGLKDAIWKSDRKLVGDGLKDAIWNEYQKGVHVLNHIWIGGLNKQ